MTEPQPVPIEAEAGYPKPAVAWAIVAALFVAYIFSFIDRMIIGLLVEPMKADLKISDTEISLLQGLAFAIFYTIAGVPLGRLIDRASRMRIVAGGVALWSLMTMLCGAAGQYWQLFVARMGVGVGEATLSPAAYSIIADSFPQRRLGLAMGVYGLGSAIGAGLAFMIGGAVVTLVASAGSVSLPVIGEVRAWQAAFLVVGAPGLLVALFFLMLPEPARRATPGVEKAVAQPPLREVIAFLKRESGSLLGLFLAVGMVNFAVFAAISWLPVLFMRVHGLSLADAGYASGGVLIIGGLIGLVGGGWVTDRLGGGAAARTRLCGYAAIAGAIAAVIFPLAPHPAVAAFFFVIFFSAAALPIGAAPSAMQEMTPNTMRATLSALYLFVVNIIGLAFGPTATALVGDLFFPFPTGIRYATAIVSPLGFLAGAVLFFMAARAMNRRAQRLDAGVRADAAPAPAQ